MADALIGPMAEELTAFVRARLDEDEAIAQAAASAVAQDMQFQPFSGPHDLGNPNLMRPINDARIHMARHDPERVLRDVAAKRAILDWLGYQDRVYGDYSVIETLELVARHLAAAAWSDHPDYKAEWCPDCEDGLVRIDGCNCGDGLPPYGHEPLCGWEQCPNGCWERLHPQPEAEGEPDR